MTNLVTLLAMYELVKGLAKGLVMIADDIVSNQLIRDNILLKIQPIQNQLKS